MAGDAEIHILNHRVGVVERAVERIADVVEEIGRNTSQLTAIEVRHAETRDGLERAFEEIRDLKKQHQEHTKKCDDRLQPIETAMPGLKEVRRWVVSGVLAGVSMIGLALVAMVLAPK